MKFSYEHNWEDNVGTFLVVQWLRICLAMQGDLGLIPGWGTKIPHVAEQLSPHATTTNPMCHNWRVCAQQRKDPA